MSAIEVGDLVYEYTLRVTGMTEYGVSFGALMSGQVPPPAEGARFDVHFEGPVRGPRVNGTVTGVDYVRMRADGRIDLDIHAEIATEDGQKIALRADGIARPRKDSSIADLRENVTLFTSSKEYAWVNPLQVWGVGTVDFATQVISIKAHSA